MMLQLFLGFSPDECFQRELKKANPYFISLMIGKKDYLQAVEHQGKQYLGKIFESHPTLDQIHDTERHLLSLLQTLTPNYPFKDHPPQLITLVNGS